MSERGGETGESALTGTSLGDDRGDVIDEWSIAHIVTTMLPLLAAMSLLQMGSGSVLETFEAELLVNPSLLVLVPVQIGTAGNLGSIMCSRLSTQLHLGTFELDPGNPDLRANIGAVIGLAATVFVLVGLVAWTIGQVLGGSLALWKVMAISLISGMTLAAWVIVLSVVAIWASYRLGYNPDDTTIPVVTNVADVTGVFILFAVVIAVL
ncbi:MAG: magnesium transporter [Haloferacaceae archaeon]